MLKVAVHQSDEQGNIYTLLEDVKKYHLSAPDSFFSALIYYLRTNDNISDKNKQIILQIKS